MTLQLTMPIPFLPSIFPPSNQISLLWCLLLLLFLLVLMGFVRVGQVTPVFSSSLWEIQLLIHTLLVDGDLHTRTWWGLNSLGVGDSYCCAAFFLSMIPDWWRTFLYNSIFCNIYSECILGYTCCTLFLFVLILMSGICALLKLIICRPSLVTDGNFCKLTLFAPPLLD